MSIKPQLQSIEAAFEEQQQLVERLRARVDEYAKGEAKPTKREKAPLRRFPSLGALIEFIETEGWERTDYTADSFMLKMAHTGGDTRPYAQYWIEDIGKRVYRWGFSLQTPDWVQIAQRRVIDVTGHVDAKTGKRVCIALAQQGDDASEEDWEDMVELVRLYEGGLNRPLESWDRHETGAKLKEIYLETHEDPGLEYTKRTPNTLGYSYNNW